MFVLTSGESKALFALSSKFAMSLFFVHTVCGGGQRNVPLSAAWFGTEAQAISPQRRGLSGSRRDDGLMSGVREWYRALITDHHPLP